MPLHHRIIHHVRKHKERVIAHIHKHQHKYILGAGILSGMAVFKLIGIVAIFFGVTYMGGGTLGGDYYDAERELQQAEKEVSIIAEGLSGCTLTGTNLTGTMTGNCPIPITNP